MCHISAEAEVICMYKTLCNMADGDQRPPATEGVISREAFLRFYEVRDLKWKQVCTSLNVLVRAMPLVMRLNHWITCDDMALLSHVR